MSSGVATSPRRASAQQTPAAPATPAPGLNLADFSQWPVEELRVAPAGRTLRGLVVAEDGQGVDFMEISRPPGRPMFLVMHWRYPRDKILDLKRLPGAEQQKLAARIEEFKNRDRAEEIGLTKIPLERSASDAPWHYISSAWLLPDKAPWLVLDSTADEEMTRRSIVRIEQVFAAYREILPPRVAAQRPLTIQLFGTLQEYQAFLLGRDLHIANPAVFIPGENRLAAGSELSALARFLAEKREQLAQIRREYDLQTAQMKNALAVLRQQLIAAGFPPADQKQLLQLAQTRWANTLQQLAQQIKIGDRKDLEQFDKVTQRMFARLFHEAFHAYLENYVYPQSSHDVPRWLNEGLAQIFESGQLESGTLRLDAPDAERLRTLQADLKAAPMLSLSDLLTADGSQFLVSHPGGEKASQRYYLYSWGLAYYLAFRQPLMETPALDRYVDRSAATADPVARFQRLVGGPLPQFEHRWRADMLSMKSDGR
jgi:hypothetical protein